MTYKNSTRRGVAIIIVLSFVVLVTTLILAFFARSQSSRAASGLSSNRARVDILAKSALEVVIGDLRQEIGAGSIVSGSNEGTVFYPRSNKTVVPFRVGASADHPNLVKVSVSEKPFFDGPDHTGSDYRPAPIRASKDAPTTKASANGRSVAPKRWNASLLLKRQNPNSKTDLSPTGFSTPHWILVSKNGHIGGPSSTEPYTVEQYGDLKFNRSSSDHFIIGRFAYAIYDVGGMLDVSAAGNSLGAVVNAKRGRLHQADLGTVPGVIGGNIKKLVEWRSAATGNDESSLFDPKRDFIAVASKSGVQDQTFFSRQDLINYVRDHAQTDEYDDLPGKLFHWDLSALTHFSFFSREKNAPTWSPATPPGSTIPYAADADKDTAINRNLALLRHSDGTPLIKQRFPLSRIALIKEKSPDVQKYFGLSPGGGEWVYNHGKIGGIYTLDEVAALSDRREPDFFELLKAVILKGSLGKAPAAGSVASNPASQSYSGDSAIDAHVLQIGANIIDQYDADSYPTDIYYPFTSSGANDPLNRFFGIENLPYLSRVFAVFHANEGQLGGWLQPELWNPHQTYNATVDVPQKFRIQALGSARTVVNVPAASPIEAEEVTFGGDSLSAGTLAGQITFDNAGFSDPWPLFTGTADSQTANKISTLSPEPVAFSTGHVAVSGTLSAETDYKIDPVSPLSFVLEYKKGDVFYPYSIWRGVNQPLVVTGTANHNAQAFFVKVDPRTDRFGVSIGTLSAVSGTHGETIRPTSQPGLLVRKHPTGTGFSWPTSSGTNGAPLGLLAENRDGSNGYYSDPDNVVRPADGYYRSDADGYPLMKAGAQHSRRPIVLNRPFRSVGELGYAFRDLPFKTLDFFSDRSGDSGLLDVFSTDDNEVVGGRYNINTWNEETLKAILLGAGTVEGDTSVVISEVEATAIAKAIVASTKSEPVMTRADLVTKLGPIIESHLSLPEDKNNKTRREAVLRALSEAANTRTWNLMIDLIAQTGRFPRSAEMPEGQPTDETALYAWFVVEGERRYWLHLAIDRYTGEILHKQLELVTE